ncbi:MAG: recombinase family protein [Pseudomonadota bacterium]
MGNKPKRCAIYTRKSSEEGLDQSFNSLDAQREACEAYILSQTSEGWEALANRYDDGGFSGGNTERPGLKALLADIEACRIDIVVVYKIDRLTRSLADFARIVEVFEANDCSFVSVTQSFNTTGSMGKLMLNVLLSFAQFEREVTGERIRDKIAASKAKGMWMGGNLPLGYDKPRDANRVLVVNDYEAQRVRDIFARYLELGSVHALQRDLEARGVLSKRYVTNKGKQVGGLPFSRGALFHLLRNPVYLGKIAHKGKIHEGEHEAIVDKELFERVQSKLDAQTRRHKDKAARRQIRAPLVGKLFDEAGEPMSPTTARGKTGRTYRYYVSASLQQGSGAANEDIMQRVSAPEIERVVNEAVQRWSPNQPDALGIVQSAHIGAHGLHISLVTNAASKIAARLDEGETILDHTPDLITVLLPVLFPTRGGQRLIVPAAVRPPQPDAVLISALRKAHAMLMTKRGMPLIKTAPSSPYDRAILRLAFLAPDIQRAILDGRQPRHLNLEALRKLDIPLAWSAQRKALGFAEQETGVSGEKTRELND